MKIIETETLYCDDNYARLPEFPDDCVDLIYLDPPFFSNRRYEVIWGDEAEVRSFEDRWEGGVQVYVEWMRERVIELRRILKPTGSFYLHCDPHASHYLKVMLDDVFGQSRFRNEIIWSYKRWTASRHSLPRLHDTIFFYTKSDEYFFEVPTVPNDDPNASQYVSAKDADGKTVVVRDDEGRAVKRDVAERIQVGDVWEIPLLSPVSKERWGYPTQKPERLLERIIAQSSRPGDVVLDPFAGCGTTLVVAEKMKRRWVGIDISQTAVGLMRRRMAKVGALDIQTIGLPVSEEQLRALRPFEFQNWVIQRMNGTHSPRKSGDMGIDGYSFMEHMPIQVKQSDSVGRNVVDNFETAIERDGKERGYIVAFSFTKGAREEVARVKNAKGVVIELVEVTELLNDASRLVTPSKGTLLGDDIPMPTPRPDRPTAAQLIKSDRR